MLIFFSHIHDHRPGENNYDAAYLECDNLHHTPQTAQSTINWIIWTDIFSC